MVMAGLKFGQNSAVYSARRATLLSSIKKRFPECAQGAILLFAGLETDRAAFRQESFFYYFTGLQEPGLALLIDFSGKQTLYVPRYATRRETWVAREISFDDQTIQHLGFDELEFWGDEIAGYQLYLPLELHQCKNLVARITPYIQQQGQLFTVYSADTVNGVQQRLLTEQLCGWIPGMQRQLVDVSQQASSLRRRKDYYEIGCITSAIETTSFAQMSAVGMIKHDVAEAEVRAAIEYVFTAAGQRAAFPSIVASGMNATILHYNAGNDLLQNGDLVVVDIGAEANGYAADITRTYPVSGLFTARQRELYALVLDTQLYIADKAEPGMWLSNKNEPERSLNQLAHAYVEKHGYGQYFPHGIGHFLGLEVHDVGNYLEPLQEGDVITIEPGIYIPQEGIGIRIEDDYLVGAKGVACLSDLALPKDPQELIDWIAAIKQEHAL